MKSVKITYYCDYCKRQIDPDVDEVMAIMPGRIGYQDSFLPDSFLPDSEDRIQHYHDYCLEYLLTLEFEPEEDLKEEDPKPPAEEKPETAPKKKRESIHKDAYYSPIQYGTKDLDAVEALLKAGWKQKDIAKECGVSETTISKWKKEIEERRRDIDDRNDKAS